MPVFAKDRINFYYDDQVGDGLPVVIQHGLGGDTYQPKAVFPQSEKYRMLVLDCRGHGRTEPLGGLDKLNLASYADDVVAMLNRCDISQAVIGGISTGAAVALSIAARYPEKVLGLILIRPAWMFEANPDNLKYFKTIYQLVVEHGLVKAKGLFRESREYDQLLNISPDNAQSLLGQFDRPDAFERIPILQKIPADWPGVTRQEMSGFHFPTLVVGTSLDVIHPLNFADEIANIIPDANFAEVTAKSIDQAKHQGEIRKEIDQFLKNSIMLDKNF
jgi:pimeloyl-ACP methyl ester carboxylesterase